MSRLAASERGQRLTHWISVIMILACAAAVPLRAQKTTPAAGQVGSAPADAITTVVVPIVGSITGMNSVRWRTAVELRNDLGTPVDVVLQLPSAPDQPFYATTLAAGQSISFADVVAEAFSQESALSPMLVSTSGSRSVTIRASAYGVIGTNVTEPQPIAIDYSGLFYPIQVLQGLSFNSAYRTNIGLVNLADSGDASFTLALQRIPGRNLAVTHLTIPPASISHTSIQTLFPLITDGNDFTVVVETSAPKTCVYASVIDNATSAGRYVRAAVGVPANAQ